MLLQLVKWPILALQDSAQKPFGMILGIHFLGKSMDAVKCPGPGDDGADGKMSLSRRNLLATRLVCNKNGYGPGVAGRLPQLGTFHTAEFIGSVVAVHDAHAIDRLDGDSVERAAASFLVPGQTADNGKPHNDQEQSKN